MLALRDSNIGRILRRAPARGRIRPAAALDASQHYYCRHRPHGGKKQNMRTPMASYQNLKEAA